MFTKISSKLVDWKTCGNELIPCYRNEFILDSAADLASLPKSAPGSVAIVADKGGAAYMVNASGEWKEV